MPSLEEIDLGAVYAMHHVYESPLGPVFVWCRYLGSALILLPLTLLGAIWFAKTKQFRSAVVLILLIGVGFGLSAGAKAVIKRPRPNLDWTPPEVRPNSYSFPSGHALLSSVVYLGIAWFLQIQPRSPRVKWITLGVAVLLTLITGFSRMAIGVHYMTDVVGGWMAGIALLALGREIVMKKAEVPGT